jgi:PleD family two-component response regulator
MLQTATKQAVASRLAAVHASINLQQAKAKKVFSRKSGNLVLAVDSTTKFQARVTKLLLMAGQTVTFATDGFEVCNMRLLHSGIRYSFPFFGK